MDASPQHPDAQLQSLKRQLQSDKESPGLLAKYHRVLRRLRGEARSSCLFDLDDWDRATEEDQDLVVARCGEVLGSFDCVGVTEYQCGSQNHRIATFRHKKSRIDFQLIPGGSFRMGQRSGEDQEALAFYKLWEHFNPGSEQPQHSVTIRKPFLMARFPVTEASNAGRTDDLDDSLPLENLPWSEALRTIHRLDRRFSLPSEAQWEFACRAHSLGTPSTLFSWGDDFDRDQLWCNSNSDFVRHPYRDHAHVPNAFGLVDMLGNTREWCADFFHPDYQGAPSNGLAQTRPLGRRHRVIRGGAWNSDAGECRCASRDFRFRRNRQSGAGVRPVYALPKI